MVDTDYITKESALSCFHDWIDRYGHEHTADEMVEYQRIEDLPVADVRPVRGGQWIKICERDEAFDLAGFYTWMSKYQCNQCGFIQSCIEDKGRYVFCPECGADMREAEHNG